MALPPWEAVIVHVPPVTVWTVDPDTVQTAGVLEANIASSPEDVGADMLTGTPAVMSAGCVKVIVCVACPVVTWNDRATSGAAA